MALNPATTSPLITITSDQKWKDEYISAYLTPTTEGEVNALEILNKHFPQQFCKYYDVSEYSLKTLMEGSIFINHPNRYQDPDDSKWYTFDIEKIAKETGLSLHDAKSIIELDIKNPDYTRRTCCFTESSIDPWMWGRFATHSQGFCLVFSHIPDRDIENSRNIQLLQQMKPMIYTTEKPDITNVIIAYERGQSDPNFQNRLFIARSLFKNRGIADTDKDYLRENEWRYTSFGLYEDNLSNCSSEMSPCGESNGPWFPSKVLLGADIDKNLKFKREVIYYSHLLNAEIWQMKDETHGDCIWKPGDPYLFT